MTSNERESERRVVSQRWANDIAYVDEASLQTSILLVDDQPQNLLALEAILEPMGQRLVRVTSGTEALKQVLQQDFSVILLDVQMPGIDGFETASLIKEREKSRHIPIIFLTAISKDEKYVFRGYNVGAVDYLFKPFDPDILRSKVSVFVDLFRKNERIRRQADLLRAAGEREVAEVKRVSERRYRDLAESMPQIVWTADPRGALTYVNRRWYDVGGLDPASEVAPDWQNVLHADDLPRFLEGWHHVVVAGVDWEAEFRFGAPGRGHYAWHLIRAVPVRDASNDVVSWIGTSTDIDGRRRAEESLRFLAEASTLFSSALTDEDALANVARRAVPAIADFCAIHVVSDAGELRRVVSVQGSQGSCDVESGSVEASAVPSEVVRTGIRHVTLDVAGQQDQRFARGARSYLCVPLVARGRTLGALTLATVSHGRRYDDSDVALAEDIARRAAVALDNAQLYAIAERERSQLEQAHRAKDEFLATLSHELRTPLNAMLGWTQLLRTEDLDPETMKRGLETVERNTRAQAQLIEDLLDVSRIITGKLHLELGAVDLATVVDAALEVVRSTADAKRITLSASTPRAVCEVWGDPARLQQVVWNLVSNAVKFTPNGGSVRVELGASEGRARVSVVDTGQGIAEDFLPHVFERFRQADSTSARSHGGLGLGLAIVGHLVELHAGEVKAKSEGVGKGATFTVDFPLLLRPASAPPLSQGASSHPMARSVAPELREARILLVEDEPDGRELLREVLERGGAVVTAVGSAAEAWTALLTEVPTVLLSDIGLPGEDGYSFMRRVRALDPARGGHVPAVALTAFASADDMARALAAGFDAHIAKPVEPGDLVHVLAGVIRTRHGPARALAFHDEPRRA